MNTELWLTIIIALVGWIWAIIQFTCKRTWDKKDMLVAKRYDAYSQYMRKCEEINENMRNDPQSILSSFNEFCKNILKAEDQKEIESNLIEFNQQIFNYIKRSTIPLFIINQELNSLFLIASEELMEKLNEQKKLITDFNNEMQNYLNIIKDGGNFQNIDTLGQTKRWIRFTSLNDEIITLMRKEINVK